MTLEEQIGESIWDTYRSIGKILENDLSREAIKRGAGGTSGGGDTDLALRRALARAEEARAKGYGIKPGRKRIAGGSGKKPAHRLTIAKEPRVGPKQHKKGK